MSAATPFQLSPEADAWVDSSRPGRNFGGGATLIVDARPAAKTIVRFNVPGDSVLEAKLALYSGAGGRTIKVRRAGNGWKERGVTWRNAPATVSSPSAAAVTKLGWTIVDVTPLTVPGRVTFVVTTPSSRATALRSRESRKPPKLVVTVNRAPVCLPASFEVTEDGLLQDRVVCSDADGDPLTYATVGGAVPVNPDGTFAFTPPTDVNGPVEFLYSAGDGKDESDAAAATIDVTAVNDAPHASADVLTTSEDSSAEHDVLVNDSDLDGDSLSVTTPQPRAANGTVDCAPEGLCTYTPNFNFYGPDSFTYGVSDGHGGTATAEASVTVAPVNDPPRANPDKRRMDEDGTLTLAAAELTANDLPGPPNETEQLLTVTRVLADDGARGTVVLGADGTIVYVPNATYNGRAHFEYEITDGYASDTGVVNVEIAAVDDAPTARRDRMMVSEDGKVVFDPRENDSPGPPNESSQALVLDSIRDGPDHGTSAVEGGRIRYVPAPGYAGLDSLVYRVCEDRLAGGCDEATVEFTVSRVAATAETWPVTSSGDAANDAAVWVHPTDPALSVVVGTDKERGIEVYDLAGARLQERTAEGQLNNVDLRDGFPFGDGTGTLVAASGKSHGRLALYRLDHASRRLAPLTPVQAIQTTFGSLSAREQYGLCLYRSPRDGRFYAFVTRRSLVSTALTEFDVEQWELFWNADEGKVEGRRVRSLRLGSQSEACVADDDLGEVYFAEAAVGIWKYGAEPDSAVLREQVDAVGSPSLGRDVEGLALVKGAGGTGYLFASNQADDAYAVYRREDLNDYVRTFVIKDANGVDGTSFTDGIEATSANLGTEFPNGAFVAQDDCNAAVPCTSGVDRDQNFKLVPLERILETGPLAENGSCGRPYRDASPWNTPVGATPAYDPVFPPSIAALAGELSSDPNQFTFPVYEVSGATPRVPVALDGWYSNVVAGGRTLENAKGEILLPIPPGATPAAGSDAQIVLVDPLTGDEWGVSNLRQDAAGRWNGWNAYHYNVRWSGVPPADASGRPFFPRGAGVPYLAGLVRPCEIARGKVEHALAFAYDSPTDEFVYPATKSDGISPHHGIDLPEGTRLQLDPALDPAQLPGCTEACETIARALQEYGMIVIDNSGREKVMAEYDGTARWNGVLTAATVNPIPLSAFRVLAPEP